MEKRELLLELEKIIESEKYDIDELLSEIPDYLLDDLRDVLKTKLKEQNPNVNLSR